MANVDEVMIVIRASLKSNKLIFSAVIANADSRCNAITFSTDWRNDQGRTGRLGDSKEKASLTYRRDASRFYNSYRGRRIYNFYIVAELREQRRLPDGPLRDPGQCGPVRSARISATCHHQIILIWLLQEWQHRWQKKSYKKPRMWLAATFSSMIKISNCFRVRYYRTSRFLCSTSHYVQWDIRNEPGKNTRSIRRRKSSICD